MSDTLIETGIIEEYKIDPQKKRISFKLNNKTYGLFEQNKDGSPNEMANEAKAIFMQNADKQIHIEYYDNEKDGKTYHNCTKIVVI